MRKGHDVSTVEDIQAAIQALAPGEYARLRRWFSERDWEEWDRQIERDSASGKLGFLFEELRQEKAKRTLREL